MYLNLAVENNALAASQVALTTFKPTCRVANDAATGVSTLTVNNTTGFAVGQILLLGNFGEPTAEIIKVHASTPPTSTVITLASNTVRPHYQDTPVTVLDYNAVEFYKASTLGGIKTLLATVSIMADRLNTVYTDLTDTTGYFFFRFTQN